MGNAVVVTAIFYIQFMVKIEHHRKILWWRCGAVRSFWSRGTAYIFLSFSTTMLCLFLRSWWLSHFCHLPRQSQALQKRHICSFVFFSLPIRQIISSNLETLQHYRQMEFNNCNAFLSKYFFFQGLFTLIREHTVEKTQQRASGQSWTRLLHSASRHVVTGATCMLHQHPVLYYIIS